jgi:hypothetical protein
MQGTFQYCVFNDLGAFSRQIPPPFKLYGADGRRYGPHERASLWYDSENSIWEEQNEWLKPERL